ncbi:CheY-like superfamily [Choanephora cucurbitarum]|nr:CheY-like superfamily [Choanephora cucurbitarum]
MSIKRPTETPKRSMSCITLQTVRDKKRYKSKPSPITPLDGSQSFPLLPAISILIVDDNSVNRSILRKHLGLIPFIQMKQIEEAENGLEALDLIQHVSFDLVLLDIDMPLMNGVETAKQIRASGSINQTVPIVAVTTKDSVDAKDHYIKVGMNDCIGKPINNQLLEQTLYRSLSLSTDDLPATDSIHPDPSSVYHPIRQDD